MIKLLPVATILTFGTFFTVVVLVTYRLLWSASSLTGAGALPRRLQRLQHWLQGEPTPKMPN